MTIKQTLTTFLSTLILCLASQAAMAQQPSQEALTTRFNNLLNTADTALDLALDLAEGFDEAFAAFEETMESDDPLVRLRAKQSMLKYVSDMQTQYNTANIYYIKALHTFNDLVTKFGPPDVPEVVAQISTQLKEIIQFSAEQRAEASKVRLEILSEKF